MTVGSTTNGTMRQMLTHRVTYQFYVGKIWKGVEIDHACRVTLCCNPAHLDRVTRSENTRRGNLAAVSLVCPNGHYKLGENAQWHRWKGRTQLICRQCRNESRRKTPAMPTNKENLSWD
jgi:hypothetical protein